MAPRQQIPKERRKITKARDRLLGKKVKLFKIPKGTQQVNENLKAELAQLKSDHTCLSERFDRVKRKYKAAYEENEYLHDKCFAKEKAYAEAVAMGRRFKLAQTMLVTYRDFAEQFA